MMARVPDTIEHGVTHVQIRRGHVDLGAHYVRAVRELAGTHARKEVEALGHRSIAEGAVAPRLGERAAMAANLVRGEAVHVRLAVADEPDGELVQPLEVVRRVVE